MGNGLKIAALYAAIIMGAGFASGQELLKYFVGYGTSGIFGLIVAGLLFAVTGWAVLDISRRKGLKNYKELITHLTGSRLGLLLEWLVAAFLFVLYVAMLSAGGAMLNQFSGLPFTLGVLIVAGTTLAVLWNGLESLVKVNAILAPIMIVGGIFMGLYTFFNYTAATAAGGAGAAHFESMIIPGWILAALVYGSYNMVTGISVLATGSTLAKSRKDCMFGGLLGGASLTLLGICMALPLYLHFADIIDVEIPFLVIVMGYGHIFTGLYLVLMLCAISTTAITNAFALTEWTSGYIKSSRRIQCMVLTILAIPAAYVGFSNIVGYVYPLFGLLGIFQILVVLMSWIFSGKLRHTNVSQEM